MHNENYKQTELLLCAPCDLYGMNARKFCSAAGGALVARADGGRVCRGDSLIGVLSLQVGKGDFIRLTMPEHAQKEVLDALSAL